MQPSAVMRHARAALRLLGGLLAVAGAACGATSPAAYTQTQPNAVQVLPSLAQLAQKPGGGRKLVAAATYELLQAAPVAQSEAGASWSSGSLNLDPQAAGGLAWAVFKLAGFPDGGLVYPLHAVLTADSAGYLGLSNYRRGTWDLGLPVAGCLPLSGGSGLLSPAPGRAVYIAVLASEQPLTATSLRVSCNASLPGVPAAVLNLLNRSACGWPTRFSAAGSECSEGATMTLTYDFGDGTPEYATDDPAEVVEHVYSGPGLRTVRLVIRDSQAQSEADEMQLEVADTVKELLVVANYDIPASRDLALYYASPDTGRCIDPQYILQLPLGSGIGETIERDTYQAAIRDAVIAFLDSHAAIKHNIKYILLCKGVPHRIGYVDSASVDSELCLLYSDLGEDNGGYPYSNFLVNDYPGLAKLYGDAGSGFYLCEDTPFTPNTFQVSADPTWLDPPSGDEVAYTLNYLVGRLSAYTYAEAKALVDRSLQADLSGSGWIIFDSSDQYRGPDQICTMDTMVDPVYPWYDPEAELCGEELLRAAGCNVFADVTADIIYHDYHALPPGAADSVIAYCGWGVHGGSPATYILDDLGFEYLPGAVFMSYESFNGVTFECYDPSDPAAIHGGQGLICDFFHRGGTVAIGNVWEPRIYGVGDERWIYSRYLIHGDRWIEAAYKGLRLLSWMEVVVGDPLCRVAP